MNQIVPDEGNLRPDKYPEKDFFIADIFDNLPVKDDMASMPHPIFSLSKKKDLRIIDYEHNGVSIKVNPSFGHGLPTIFDKDILLYCGSLLMEEVNKGRIPPKALRFSSHDLMITTQRNTDKGSYELLDKALDRLAGVLITTNIKTNGIEQKEAFHLIESHSSTKNDFDKSRRVALEITVSDWFYNSIIGKEVLTINRDYFRLGRPIERRLYEIARKHCGNKAEWTIGLEPLKKKTGSTGTLNKFRFFVREIARDNYMPDYGIVFKDENDMVTFINKDSIRAIEDGEKKDDYPILQPDTYEKAVKKAPGYDVYFLEKEWHELWDEKGRPEFKKGPDATFLGFCAYRHEKNPLR